ncbi:MAG: D-aminoacylase [Candidatus Calescibacterium sp.]|nr:D-aminoacylase [Candidatus Calescibacterium sp.]MCX7758522.1 D-aminoacylase [bacterium]
MKTILKNGYVVDGSRGSLPRKGSVVVDGDKIVDVIYSYSDNGDFQDYEVVDIEGLYICPGFIDVHSHSDLTIIAHPESESAISQGVTTVVSGNCGFSVCPVDKTLDNVLTEAKSYGINDISWRSVGQYLDFIRGLPIVINYAYLVGHGQIRAEVVGYSDRLANEEEIGQMRYEVEKALDGGAIGLSLGLIYIPGRFSNLHELVELSKVVGSKGKIVTNHMRSESSHLLEAIDESIGISRLADVNFEVSHLKAAGVGKGKAESACKKILKAISEGVRISADQYPYTASNTGLSQVLPPQYLEGSIEEIIRKIADDPVKVAQDIENYPHTPWDKILISEAYNPKVSKYLGMSIRDISMDLRLPEALTVIELMKMEEYDLGAIYFLMDQDEVDYIATQDFVMVASDSAVRNCNSNAFPHPRTFGTFTRFISYYVKERKLLTLSEAIYKMTGFPASKFGIINRGLIKRGYFADLVIFDFDKISDNASYVSPKLLSDGIEFVFVNGKMVYKDKKVLGYAGRILT